MLSPAEWGPRCRRSQRWAHSAPASSPALGCIRQCKSALEPLPAEKLWIHVRCVRRCYQDFCARKLRKSPELSSIIPVCNKYLFVGGVKSTHNVDHLAFFKPAARVRHATLFHALIAVRAVEVRVGVPVFVAVVRVGHAAALKLRWMPVARKHEVDVRLVAQC